MKTTESDYIPIDCGYYDRLEEFAVRRVQVDVVRLDGLAPLRGLIVDLFSRDKVEYCRLESATGPVEFRLDEIHSVNGIIRPDSSGVC